MGLHLLGCFFFCLDWVCFTFRIDVGLFCGLALLQIFCFFVFFFQILVQNFFGLFFFFFLFLKVKQIIFFFLI